MRGRYLASGVEYVQQCHLPVHLELLSVRVLKRAKEL
jgi:hypothetical protein